jgi:hypothetical protein
MFMKGMFILFMSLGIGYGLCVVAKKQGGLLKTVGYTLGIAILVLSLVYGLLASELASQCFGMKARMGGFGKKMSCPMYK